MDEGNTLKNKLLDSYKNLVLDDKRNEFSKEMIMVSTLINSCLSMYGVSSLKTAYDYKVEQDLKLSEEDLLIKNYEDILDIRNNLLLLLTHINNK